MPIPRISLTSSRLAARTGLRQVEALAQADAAGTVLDREVGRAWQDVLAVLRTGQPHDYHTNYHRALRALHGLTWKMTLALAGRLRALAVWGHRAAASAALDVLPAKTLRAAVVLRTARVREDTSDSLYQSLLFPPPTEADVTRIVFGPTAGTRPWQERMAGLSSLAPPEQLALTVASGMAAGKSQRQIAQDLLPQVDNVRSSARRIARTEGLRVAHETQMQAWDGMGDMVEGFQVHATLDQHTRPWHAARHGTIYYKRPKPGQKGMRQLPHPPEEAEDQYERPPGTPQTAFNCRCWISPVLAPAEHVEADPALQAVFSDAEGNLVPDPVTYSDWWRTADDTRRRLAVGSKRYAIVQGKLGERPAWEDFLNPETGDILPIDYLKREPEEDRYARVQDVAKLLADRRELIRRVGMFGYLP